jgi:RES domain-containing protein
MGRWIELVGYRLTSAEFADRLDGEGAALGRRNRWNEVGQRVTYAASSRALALLESRVHSPVGPPFGARISVIRLALPEEQISIINPADLPGGWQDPYETRHCQIRGARWYRECPEEKLLIVPSVLVPAEQVYVIRGGIPEAKIESIEEVEFDPRLWVVARPDEGLVYTLSEPSKPKS